MMAKFQIEVEEILQRVVDVEADSLEEAIKNYSLAIEANHTNFDYKTDSLPELSGFYDQNVFVNSLLLRASAYLMSYSQTHNLTDLIYAFSHYQLCDTMVANMRHSAITKNDKLELGKIVSKCCEGALSVCYELINAELPENQIRYFQQQAFSFAEKGKSNSLLESMVGQDAMKLANIPENLQQIENQSIIFSFQTKRHFSMKEVPLFESRSGAFRQN